MRVANDLVLAASPPIGQSACISDVAGDRVTTQLGEVVIAKAIPKDAADVLRLRDTLASWMVESGIDQWRPGEMPLAWIEVCAAQGWVFVARHNGNVVGSVTLVWTDPLIWVGRDEPAGYIHMLMVDRAYAHAGLGLALLGWAELQILRTGRRRARLDCVRDNAVLRAYYEHAGYMLVGYRNFAVGIPDVALYEQLLGD
jgi:GNAT superfamily N-acetyltransferase